MVEAPYVIGYKLGEPVELVVADALPPVDETLTLDYTVGRLADNDRFGTSLFLHYSDAESGAELLDVMLLALPDDVLDRLSKSCPVTVRDTVSETVITLCSELEATANV